jgi:uncharacterized protein (TIGR02996 family)
MAGPSAELEAHLAAHPDDVDALRVYADALQARGDPRGELIVVQLQRAAAPEDVALAAREGELLRRHRAAWLGELAELRPRDLGVTWRHGFVHGVRIGPPLEAHQATDIDVGVTLGRVMRLPAVERVRELAIGAIESNGYPTTWTAAIAGIAAHGVPPNVEALSVRCGSVWELAHTSLGDLSPAYPRLAGLRALTIEMGTLELGAIALPELRSLEIRTMGLTRANLRSMRGARWPRLESLWLSFGEPGESRPMDIEPGDLGWIFAGENLGGVRRLGLASASFTDELALGLAGSRVLAQLESLDLSLGTLSDAGARAIIGNAAAFRHLRELDLSHAYLSDDVRAALASLGPHVVLDDPQSPDDDFRYPAIR